MAALQRLARLSDLSSAAALCSSHSVCSPCTLKSADTASLATQSHRSLITAQAGNSALQIRPSENGAARSRVPSNPPSPVFKAPSVVNPANDTPVIFDNAPSRVGGLVRKGKAYKERFVIRSYEVGMHKSASIESIANLLQVGLLFNAPVIAGCYAVQSSRELLKWRVGRKTVMLRNCRA